MTKAKWILALVLLAAGCDQTVLDPGDMLERESAVFQSSERHRFSHTPTSGKRYLVELTARTPATDLVAAEITNRHGGDVVYRFRRVMNGFSLTLPDEAAAAALSRDPRVLRISEDYLVEPDQVVSQSPAPNGLDRIDQRYLPTNDEFNAYQTGSGVFIYVIDSGIDASHPDFGGRVSTSVWGDWVGTGPFDDCTGHGTNVASVAGGASFGVAKNATLVSLRVAGCSGSAYMGTIASAIDFAVDAIQNGHGPGVINISMSREKHWWQPWHPDEDAAQAAVNAGIPVVVSAGNDGKDACDFAPAAATGAVTVGATDLIDNRFESPGWWESNWGSCIDLFAPGIYIDAASPGGGSTGNFGGTSAAAPHVAGTAALVISSTGVSDSEFVSERIKESATRWVVGNIAGTGSPDALVYSPHTSAKVFGVSEIDIIDSYTWTAGAYGGDGVYSYQWQIKLGTEPWDNLIGQTGWSYTRPVGIGHPDFQLRIQVTTFGEIVYGTKTIDVLICDPEEDEDCNA